MGAPPCPDHSVQAACSSCTGVGSTPVQLQSGTTFMFPLVSRNDSFVRVGHDQLGACIPRKATIFVNLFTVARSLKNMTCRPLHNCDSSLVASLLVSRLADAGPRYLQHIGLNEHWETRSIRQTISDATDAAVKMCLGISKQSERLSDASLPASRIAALQDISDPRNRDFCNSPCTQSSFAQVNQCHKYHED